MNMVKKVGNKKLDSEEIFEEIESLLHGYSMKFYSKHQNNKKVEEEVQDESV